jgi:hypothetical protein
MNKKVYLPANLNIDSHIEQYPPIHITNFEKEKLVYFLSLILSVPANNKKLSKEKSDWVPLHSQLLIKYIGKDYKQYINYALGDAYPNEREAKLIKTDNYFISGKKSKGYSFISSYGNHDQIIETTLTFKPLLRKLRKATFDQQERVIALYPNLVKWFNHKKLRIDATHAREYANLLLKWEGKKSYDQMMYLFNKPGAITQKEHKEFDERPSLQRQRLNYLTNINRIEEGDFFLGVDNNVRRFHSNLTNLKSELRYFITYDGQKLVSIDVKNSQPFLCISLFNSSFLGGSGNNPTTANYSEISLSSLRTEEEQEADLEEAENELLNLSEEDILYNLSEDFTATHRRHSDIYKISNVAPAIYEALRSKMHRLTSSEGLMGTQSETPLTHSSSSLLPLLSSLIMYSENFENTIYSDIIQFKDSVIEGRFYEDFLELLHSEGITEISTRGEAKKAIYLVLFTSNQFINSGEAIPKRLFKETYPNVYKYFSLFKLGDKSRLSRLLQSIESWLILDKISERISNERPNIPIFTIHDSIVTTLGNEEYVTSVMTEVFNHYVGTSPRFDVKVYDPSNLPTSYESYITS